MNQRAKFVIFAFFILAALEGCGQFQAVSTPTLLPTTTLTMIPTTTSTFTPIPTSTSTFTPIPTTTATPTAVPQIFHPIFPEDFTGAGVAANHPGEDLHFDVGIPVNFIAEKDAIISPASGLIIDHYFPGDGNEGECITIMPEPPLQGVDEIVLSLGRDPDEIKFVYFHLSHIIPYKISGWIAAGEEAGVVHDRMTRLGQWSNIVAFVVRIGFELDEIQISPCELPNKFDWCEICYPGAAERNPCP